MAVMAKKQPQELDPALVEATINSLLTRLKQPPAKVKNHEKSWVEHYFSAPRSAEAIIWRFCWLAVVPAIVALVFIPIGQWCFVNYLPWIPLLFLGITGVGYWLFYCFAHHTAGSQGLKRLIDVQMSIPPSVWCLLLFLEVVKHG